MIKEDAIPRAPEVVHSSGLVSSSVCQPFHYITTRSLERLAKRCQTGVDRKGEDKSWNATKPEKMAVAADRSYLLERISHGIKHLLRLRDLVVRDQDPLGEGVDDDAAAVMWTGMFLCEATQILHESANLDE